MELRLDANGAWEVDEAVASINALAPAGPRARRGARARRRTRCARCATASPVRVAMDETAGQPGSLTAKVADAVCLKVSRCGGISRLLAQAALVRASGADVYLASTFDGPLGIAAAVHCAAALQDDRGLRAGDARAVRRRAHGAARRATARSPCPRSPGSASSPPPRSRASDRLGASRGQAVAGARRRPRARRRAAPPPGARRARRTSGRRLAGEDRRRHRQLAQAVPQRRHRAGAHARAGPRPARAGRCAAGPRARCAAAVGRRAGEERLRGPAVGELLDGRAVGEGGEALVVGAARGALGLVRDAGGGGDEHEALDALGRRQRDVLRDPAAHRVAAQDEALGRRGEHVGHAGLEGHRPRVARVAVAAQVGRQRRIAFGIQALDHRIPGAPRSGEAVQEDDGGGHRPRILTETIDTYLLLRAFVDELARCGLAGACTSPGSRSTPLVLTLARQPGLPTWSHVDERVAGFFALGVAKQSGRPAAVACTSGTAAAHYLPAVIEAHEARVPLDRAHRRPPARAARGRRRADDRPAQALRRRGEVVLRGRHARARRPSGCAGCASSPSAPTRRPCPGAPAPCT